MSIRVLRIPACGDEGLEEELNRFLRSHRVLQVKRRLMEVGFDSYWTFCIEYVETASPTGSSKQREKPRVDYRELLSPADFAVYSQLRELRKTLSQTAAVPVYAVFTNDQLAQMVQTRAQSKADLERIAGVGDGRIDRYGESILTFLQQQWSQPDAASQPPV